jgi:hypothetical protein
VKRNRRVSGVKVSADGTGVVSHAGVGMLREMADYTGLTDSISKELLDTYRGVPGHPPGRVFADLAVAVADGADAISGIEVLTDRQELFGPVASMPTCWRVLDRIATNHLPGLRSGCGSREGLGRGCGPSPGSAVVSGFRCHDHNCSSGEGERGHHLETHARVPPVVVFSGRARDRRRRSIGWCQLGCCAAATPAATLPPIM